MSHTKTPWTVDTSKHQWGFVGYKVDAGIPDQQLPIAIVGLAYHSSAQDMTTNCLDERNAEQRANAEFIVRAVNCHEQLLAALKRAEHLLDATMRYMQANEIACEYTIVYDEAECDGHCLGEDCATAAEDARIAIAAATDIEQAGRKL